MKYRIKELNRKFYIEGELREYDLYWQFGWKKKNIKYVWYRLNNAGRLNSYDHIGILFARPFMKGFKTLEKAKAKISALQEKPKYHY